MNNPPTSAAAVPAPKRLHWSLYCLAWVLGICLGGALLSVIVYPLGGALLGAERSGGQLALTGLRTLGFYFSIWAPGIAIVLTVKREYEARQASADRVKSENPVDR
jgi:hypothetical protein